VSCVINTSPYFTVFIILHLTGITEFKCCTDCDIDYVLHKTVQVSKNKIANGVLYKTIQVSKNKIVNCV
jgi:hypothetical protein